MEKFVKGMQEATIVISEQEDILQGAIKMYGALPVAEASKYHEIAHAALDKLLDAHRAKHYNIAALIRSGSGD